MGGAFGAAIKTVDAATSPETHCLQTQVADLTRRNAHLAEAVHNACTENRDLKSRLNAVLGKNIQLQLLTDQVVEDLPNIVYKVNPACASPITAIGIFTLDPNATLSPTVISQIFKIEPEAVANNVGQPIPTDKTALRDLAARLAAIPILQPPPEPERIILPSQQA